MNNKIMNNKWIIICGIVFVLLLAWLIFYLQSVEKNKMNENIVAYCSCRGGVKSAVFDNHTLDLVCNNGAGFKYKGFVSSLKIQGYCDNKKWGKR